MQEKIKVHIRAEFSDWLGSGHIASFDTDIAPGTEQSELDAIVVAVIESSGFKNATVTSTKITEL